VGYEIWEDEEKNTPKEPYGWYTDGRAVRLKERGLNWGRADSHDVSLE
jgi:hypothetical protein